MHFQVQSCWCGGAAACSQAWCSSSRTEHRMDVLPESMDANHKEHQYSLSDIHSAAAQVEGTCSGKYGFVIAVTGVVEVSQVRHHS